MAKPANVISHWCQLIENFQASSMEFYGAFERAIQMRCVPEIHSAQVEHKEGGLASANRIYLRMHRGKHAFDICAAPFGTGFFVSWWLTEPPLRFGFLYLLAVCFGVLIFTNIVWMVAFGLGAVLSGITFGMLLGSMMVLLGIPLILWLFGNALRNGVIAGESTVLAIPIVGRIYEWIFAPSTYYSIDTALMFQEAVHAAVLEVIDCMTTAKGLRALSPTERKPVMKGFEVAV
jgi:hypothetical protein